MVCCQGLIGGREKRIIGLWDLNPGLESGPKSALPLNLYFPDHSSIPQEKIIYFFLLLRLFSRWQHNSLLLSRIFGADCFLSSPAFPRFLSLASFISRGSPAFTIIPFSRQLHQSNNKSIEIESHCAASESNNISRSSCYTPSSTPAPLHARTPCLHLRTRPRLTSGLRRQQSQRRRQQGQREVYINSPAPTHTSLATLNNFLLSANN